MEEEPRRVLCLHGWRTNPSVMQFQAQDLSRRLSEACSMHFMAARVEQRLSWTAGEFRLHAGNRRQHGLKPVPSSFYCLTSRNRKILCPFFIIRAIRQK